MLHRPLQFTASPFSPDNTAGYNPLSFYGLLPSPQMLKRKINFSNLLYPARAIHITIGVGMLLNGVAYANNSIVTITDIGTGSAALLCTTTNSLCCHGHTNPETQWYFPNGNRLMNTFESGIPIGDLPYYRTRSRYNRTRTDSGSVLLNRNPQGTTTGIFHCDILDASGVLQSIYVGIYTSTTGE